MNNKQHHTPIHVRPIEHDSSKPFDGDLLGRKQLADRLTGFIERLQEGCVFAIDAPWGEGKTWFAKNWQSLLNAQQFGNVYIDAFKFDYIEDPFLMLYSEVLSEIGKEPAAKKKIISAGRKVAKAILPATAKTLVNLGGRALLGSANLSEDLKNAGEEFDKGLSDVIEKHIEKRLNEFESEKKSVDGFATVLCELAKNRGKPLVVIIDELDRCRPDFAIKTIERIKHFFDVPGIVFVLLLNRTQFESYVCGVYGSSVGASEYLGKFVQFWLKLPKTLSLDERRPGHNQTYCHHLSHRFGLEEHIGFRNAFALLATLMNLSLRDLERGYTLLSLGQPMDKECSALVAWPIVLKLSKPDVFNGVVSGDSKAHSTALSLINGLIGNNKNLEVQHVVFTVMAELHNRQLLEQKPGWSESTLFVISQLGWRFEPDKYLSWLFKQIDLNIQN